ncbi:MAG: hypothetical protein JOY94_03580, partial [Methylobacteriaceae bacterium]|nr:hypothetical protein [Methylobacteriaceae bacterium]
MLRSIAIRGVRRWRDIALFALSFGALVAFTILAHAQTTLLNVSYDPTR